MINRKDVQFPGLRVEDPVPKGFRFGPYPGDDAEEEENKNWMKSVAVTNSLIKANLTVVRDAGKIYFEATKNIPASVELYLCPGLGDGFLTADMQTRLHQFFLPHPTERNMYECDICHRYYRSDYLISHKASHTDEYPYKCEICNKSFRWTSNLTRHMLDVHREKYDCDRDVGCRHFRNRAKK